MKIAQILYKESDYFVQLILYSKRHFQPSSKWPIPKYLAMRLLVRLVVIIVRGTATWEVWVRVPVYAILFEIMRDFQKYSRLILFQHFRSRPPPPVNFCFIWVLSFIILNLRSEKVDISNAESFCVAIVCLFILVNHISIVFNRW